MAVEPSREPAYDDLTARARIRQAALSQFAEHGFERTTIRGIAAEAGVSSGLVRHHFGSKQALRDAVDAHVLAEVRRISDEVMKDTDRGDFASSMTARQPVQAFQAYITRALLEGSAGMAAMFDQMVAISQEWLTSADRNRTDVPFSDVRTRAAVLNAMALGIPLMREHLSRVLGVDTFSPEGDRLVALAALDIYSNVLVSPELAASARAALEATIPHPPTSATSS